jgi:hypothetical protein
VNEVIHLLVCLVEFLYFGSVPPFDLSFSFGLDFPELAIQLID